MGAVLTDPDFICTLIEVLLSLLSCSVIPG